MNANDRKAFAAAFANFNDLEDLREINKLLHARFNAVQSQRQKAAAKNLREGCEVTFTTKKAGVVVGRVYKINAKSVRVMTKHGEWAVAPSLLTVLKAGGGGLKSRR